MNLATLLDRFDLDVLDHLAREADVPVLGGLQAQGDLAVVPASFLPFVQARGDLRTVPATGAELVRGAAGANPHTLVADPWTCRWSDDVHDGDGLAIALFENTDPVWLVHPEHGGTGVAPGRWVVRRQREWRARREGLRGGVSLVED